MWRRRRDCRLALLEIAVMTTKYNPHAVSGANGKTDFAWYQGICPSGFNPFLSMPWQENGSPMRPFSRRILRMDMIELFSHKPQRCLSAVAEKDRPDLHAGVAGARSVSSRRGRPSAAIQRMVVLYIVPNVPTPVIVSPDPPSTTPHAYASRDQTSARSPESK